MSSIVKKNVVPKLSLHFLKVVIRGYLNCVVTPADHKLYDYGSMLGFWKMEQIHL